MLIGFLLIATIILVPSRLAWGKKAKASAEDSSSSPPPPPAALPTDLNDASLRVTAIDMLYQLDLNTAQLNVVRTVASPSSQARTAAPNNGKLAGALQDLHNALLETTPDDQKIATLRNNVVDLVSTGEVHLDDEVNSTEEARAHAAQVCAEFKASQIAAYLASHADEISDPEETMMASLTDLRQSGSSADVAGEIQETSSEVGRLVGGMDDAKVKEIFDQVSDCSPYRKSYPRLNSTPGAPIWRSQPGKSSRELQPWMC